MVTHNIVFGWEVCEESRIPLTNHDLLPDTDSCFKIIIDALKEGVNI